MFGNKKRTPERQRPAVELLEPRVLYSADLTPAALAGGALLGPAEHRLLDQAVETRAQEVVFVDTATPDYQVLIDDITRQAGPGRDIEVILLDGKSDGIEQISDALAGRSDISAVHVISHGADGSVQLGAGTLDVQTLHTQEALIAGWREALTADADLLIYGCDVAATAEGRALIDALVRLTGADVAASTDNTGHAALGGNWDLEYRIGAIEAQLALSQEAQDEWFSLLAAPSLAGANNLGAINEDPASNPGTLVSALIAGQVTDPDAGALTGIAVTAVDNTNGAWQYSTDGGGNWSNFGTPTEASARLLAADANTYVRFVPNADWNGTVTNGLTFRAWDQTSGAAGGTADTTSATNTVRDSFNAVSYSNDDGTATWSAGWVDTDGDPSGGSIRVTGGELVLSTLIGTDSIYREADLSGATSATLSFSYNNLLGLLGTVSLQASNDGGGSYTTLATFSDVSNTGSGTFSTDISGYIAANTRIQFVMDGFLLGGSLHVDDVQISYATSLNGGGTAFSAATASSSIDVTAVNDAPVGTSNTVSVLEDGTHVFSASEFGFSDPNDSPANSLLAVQITTLPGAGTLTNNGVAVTAGQFVSAADIGAGLLAFTPAANANGAGYASFSFQVQDDGGGADLDGTARTMTVDVTAVNDVPVGVPTITGTLTEDQVLTAGTSGISDADGLGVFSYQWLRNGGIIAGATASTYTLGDADVGAAIGVVASYTDGYGTAESVSSAAVGPIANVNDAPVGTSNTVTMLEDGAYTFTAAEFGFSDPNDSPANSLLAVRITTLPGAGTLTNNGVAVTAGQFVSALDIGAGLLVFTPAANANGAGYASFGFQVQDDGGGADLDTTARTMGIDVSSVNDAPVGTSNTVSVLEDGTHVFSASEFGFSDPNDSPANSLLAVRITTLPGAGTLTNNGVAVTAGQFVSAANIAAGLLAFAPAANANGAGYASFSFQVQDDGGGADLDTTARTMTLNVSAVNDAPVLSGANNLTSIVENPSSNPGTLVSALITGQMSDVDAGALTGIAVTAADNTNGTWQYSTNGGGIWNNFGAPTETSARLLAADASTYVRFVPNANFSGTVTNGLTFRAWDQTTGTAGGTADLTLSVTATVRDNFGTTYYNNNDGTAAWKASWVDVDADPVGGRFQINSGLLDIRVVNPLGDIYREVNLAAATSATLSFDYQSDLGTGVGGLVLLQVSNNGGASYTTIANFSDVSNTGTGTFSADISAYMAANTRIRFSMAGQSTPTKTIEVDNLQISYVVPAIGGTTAFSGATASSSIDVTAVNEAPVGVPTITGTLTEDQVLTADTGGISDADGLGVFSYQWLRNGGIIAGATASTYTLGDADVGAQISVAVSYTDAQGTNEGPLTSAQTALVANVNDTPAGVPTITGTVTEDQVLTADTSGIGDADGLGTFSYQWLRDGVATGGATSNTYTLGDADVGTQISVAVSYTDAQGTNEGPLTSAQTALVANVNDAPTGAVSISGTPTEDQVLTASNTLADADGLGPIGYQWQRNGVDIAGATASTYTLGDADAGTAIGVVATYTDGYGTAESVSSAAVGPIANVNDAPVGTANTITMLQDGSHVFGSADFGFGDPSDNPANALLAVQITTVPAAGTLTNDGTAVVAGQLVSAADIGAGLLVFTPVAGASGAGYASFTFQVQDDGGGSNLDGTARTLTINVNAVAVIVLPPAPDPVVPPPSIVPLPPPAASPPPPAADATGKPAVTAQRPSGGGEFFAFDTTVVEGTILPPLVSPESLRGAAFTVGLRTFSPGSLPGEGIAEAVTEIRLGGERMLQLAQLDSVLGRGNRPESLADEFDQLRDALRDEARLQQGVVGALAFGSLSLTVGYVLWILRGGVLVASVLSTLPAWRFLDPLPILAQDDDDEDKDQDDSADDDDVAFQAFLDEGVR